MQLVKSNMGGALTYFRVDVSNGTALTIYNAGGPLPYKLRIRDWNTYYFEFAEFATLAEAEAALTKIAEAAGDVTHL